MDEGTYSARSEWLLRELIVVEFTVRKLVAEDVIPYMKKVYLSDLLS